MKNLVLWGTFLAIPVFLLAAVSGPSPDTAPVASDYKLLSPISHGDLTIFPVVTPSPTIPVVF